MKRTKREAATLRRNLQRARRAARVDHLSGLPKATGTAWTIGRVVISGVVVGRQGPVGRGSAGTKWVGKDCPFAPRRARAAIWVVVILPGSWLAGVWSARV